MATVEEPQRNEEGKFVKGNSVWRAALEKYGKEKMGGRPRVFETPDDMVNMAIEYFEWCDDNPLPEQKVFHSQGVITKTTYYHPRPYNFSGLFSYCNISNSSWVDYKNRSEFSKAVEFITESIKDQKLSGGLAGYYNANLVARDLGLRDAQDVDQKVTGNMEHTHTGPYGDAVTALLADKLKREGDGGE